MAELTEDIRKEEQIYNLKIKEYDNQNVLWTGGHPLQAEVKYHFPENELSQTIEKVIEMCVALDYVKNEHEGNLMNEDLEIIKLEGTVKTLFSSKNDALIYIRNLKTSKPLADAMRAEIKIKVQSIRSMIDKDLIFSQREKADEVLKQISDLEFSLENEMENYQELECQLGSLETTYLNSLQSDMKNMLLVRKDKSRMLSKLALYAIYIVVFVVATNYFT